MYNFFSGYGRGNSLGEFYFSTLSDDQAGNSFTEWNNKTVPSSSGLYSGPYENIRHCMSIIEGVRSSKLEAAKRNNFEGQARLNRAIQFFTLVKRYGDVTWVDHKVDVNDKGLLYGPRTNRDVVMDSVLRDLCDCNNLCQQRQASLEQGFGIGSEERHLLVGRHILQISYCC